MEFIVKRLPLATKCKFPADLINPHDINGLIFQTFLLDILRNRGIAVQGEETLARKLVSLIKKGYVCYWKELLRLPREVYAKYLVSMIDFRKVIMRRLQKELRILIESPEVFENKESLHTAYVYLAFGKTITEDEAKATIGKTTFLLTKYQCLNDILSWHRLAKKEGINLSSYCEQILYRIYASPKSKRTMLCFEEMMEELINTDSNLISELANQIAHCFQKVYSQNKINEHSKKLFFTMAKKQREIALMGIVHMLDEERYNVLHSMWARWGWPEGNPQVRYKNLFKQLGRS